MTDASERVKELENELDKVTNELSTAKEALNNMAKEGEKLNMELKYLQEDLQNVLTKKTEHSRIKEECDHLKIELETSNNKMKDLEQELQKLRTEMSSIMEQNQNLGDTRVTAQTGLQTLIAQLEGQLKEVHKVTGVLKARVKELEKKLLVAEADLRHHEQLPQELPVQPREVTNEGDVEVVSGDIGLGEKLMNLIKTTERAFSFNKLKLAVGVVIVSIIIALILKHPLLPIRACSPCLPIHSELSESKLNNLQSKLSQALAEKDDAVQNLNASKRIVEDLTQEMASERQKLQTEIAKMTDASEKVKELEIELGKVRNALNRSEFEKVKMEEKLNQMAEEGEKLNTQLKDLQEDLEIALSKKEMKDLKQNFEELRLKRVKEFEDLRAKILDNKKIEASLKSKTLELSAKDSLIDEMHMEIGLLKNSERALKEKTSALKSRLSSTQKDQQKYTEALETKLAQLGTQPGALAEANAMLNEELAVSESKLNDLQSKLSQALAQKDDALQNLTTLKRKVEDFTKEVNQQTEMLSFNEQHPGHTSATAQTGLQTLIAHLERQLKEVHEVTAGLLKARAKELEEKLLVAEAVRNEGGEAEVVSRGVGLGDKLLNLIKTIESLFSFKMVIGVVIVSIVIALIRKHQLLPLCVRAFLRLGSTA